MTIDEKVRKTLAELGVADAAAAIGAGVPQSPHADDHPWFS
jgi:hypothetical protein